MTHFLLCSLKFLSINNKNSETAVISFKINLVEGYIKLYEEPQFDEEGNFKKEEVSEETKAFKSQLPMKEGVLKTNLGIPVIIVVNKSDIVNQATERRRYEEDSEFIIKHIRNFALSCKKCQLKFRRGLYHLHIGQTEHKSKYSLRIYSPSYIQIRIPTQSEHNG